MTEITQDLAQERINILTAAAEHRRREIMNYQINIDNFRAAIDLIDERYTNNDHMQVFREQLQGLLESSLIEQTKEAIMLEVVENQLQL